MTRTSSADIAISASGISKRFGGALAVDDVSLRIAPGEIHSIVGENGAGKSTLMRVMAGIIESDSGSVEVFGTPVDPGTRAAINAGIALVHQTPATERNATALQKDILQLIQMVEDSEASVAHVTGVGKPN